MSTYRYSDDDLDELRLYKDQLLAQLNEVVDELFKRVVARAERAEAEHDGSTTAEIAALRHEFRRVDGQVGTDHG